MEKNSEFVDVGIILEKFVPDSVPDNIFTANLNTYNFVRVKLQHSQYQNQGGGILVYYRTKTCIVSNVEVKPEIGQIYFNVKLKKDHEINFDACAFYIRTTRGLFDFQLEESVKLRKGKFNTNRPFFAIGDINVNVMTDVNGKIESVKGSRIDKLPTEFEHLLLRNNLQHHNIVPNGNYLTTRLLNALE